MGIALLQMAVFIENTEAKARDSDGDGISDVGKSNDVFSKKSVCMEKKCNNVGKFWRLCNLYQFFKEEEFFLKKNLDFNTRQKSIIALFFHY